VALTVLPPIILDYRRGDHRQRSALAELSNLGLQSEPAWLSLINLAPQQCKVRRKQR
jgi:hypothetical protein